MCQEGPGLADTGPCDLGPLADGNATCCFQNPFKVRWSEVSLVGISGNAIWASPQSKKRPKAGVWLPSSQANLASFSRLCALWKTQPRLCACQSHGGIRVAHRSPLSKGFSRQEYGSGLPFPSPGNLPDPGIELGSSAFLADSLLFEPPGKAMITEKQK